MRHHGREKRSDRARGEQGGHEGTSANFGAVPADGDDQPRRSPGETEAHRSSDVRGRGRGAEDLETVPTVNGKGSARGVGRLDELTFRGNLGATRHGFLRLTPAYSVHLVR